MVRNASELRPVLQHLVLPVGPLRVHLDRSGASALPGTRVKIDLNNVVMTAYAMTRRELDLDLGSSISAGAPVFRAPGYFFGEEGADSALASGTVSESTIFLSEVTWRTREEDREIFAHERVHILQRDQLFLTLADPAGERLIHTVPVLRRLDKYVDIHFTGFIFPALSIAFRDYERRPWELEAFYLSEHR